MYLSSTLHLFNPSHDEALAAASPYYYPSQIARRLSVDWAMLPMLWAEEGDVIYVPNKMKDSSQEARAISQKEEETMRNRGIRLVGRREMTPHFWDGITHIEPWGWDALICHQLVKMGAPARLIPSAERLEQMRMLSARHTTTEVLPRLMERLRAQGVPVTGESYIAHDMAEVMRLVSKYGRVVVKSLWSCSGRGVFTIGDCPTPSDEGRINKLLRTQGAVEVEPRYEGIMDLALEFDAKASGDVAYRGLSLFLTSPGGGYKANIVAKQEALQKRLFQSCPFLERHFQTLSHECEKVLSEVIDGRYEGPLGVDMMVVKDDEGNLQLHPCIEVNVRRTMGYVACTMGERGIEQWPEKYPFSRM